MFKRFKNWLIKKLGGYTEDEFKAMNNIANTMADAARKLTEPIEMAKDIKAYCISVDRCANCVFPRELGAECPLTDKLPYCWDLLTHDK